MARDQRMRRTAPGGDLSSPHGAAPADLADHDPGRESAERRAAAEQVGEAEGAAQEAPEDAGHAAPESAPGAGSDGTAQPEPTAPPGTDDVHAEGAPAPARSTPLGILCRVAGPGSVAGHGIRLDGRPAHFWEAGSRGYFSQAAIDKLPLLLIPEPP
jgi:hypothetical protein